MLSFFWLNQSSTYKHNYSSFSFILETPVSIIKVGFHTHTRKTEREARQTERVKRDWKRERDWNKGRERGEIEREGEKEGEKQKKSIKGRERYKKSI